MLRFHFFKSQQSEVKKDRKDTPATTNQGQLENGQAQQKFIIRQLRHHHSNGLF